MRVRRIKLRISLTQLDRHNYLYSDCICNKVQALFFFYCHWLFFFYCQKSALRPSQPMKENQTLSHGTFFFPVHNISSAKHYNVNKRIKLACFFAIVLRVEYHTLFNAVSMITNLLRVRRPSPALTCHMVYQRGQPAMVTKNHLPPKYKLV